MEECTNDVRNSAVNLDSELLAASVAFVFDCYPVVPLIVTQFGKFSATRPHYATLQVQSVDSIARVRIGVLLGHLTSFLL
jgi:hypothetical protein